MAAAGDGYLTPWGWVADNFFSFEQEDGSICYQGMRIEFRDLPQDSPIVVDARAILNNIDIEALDTSETEALLAYERTPEGGGLDDDQMRQSAVGTMVAEILFAELAAKGYDVNPSPISMRAETACEE
ncbi:MAG: hypothetical protein JWP85_91 [Rhodoglobus sp.]|nr:hypothetical protein [Rhodoglobus sp.]